jgi:hypothetical protein
MFSYQEYNGSHYAESEANPKHTPPHAHAKIEDPALTGHWGKTRVWR